MQNYDFSDQKHVKLFSIYSLKSKKFVLANTVGSMLSSAYVLIYILTVFTFEKNFEKFQLVVLEWFNLVITIVLVALYMRMLTISKHEALKILFFYFYYKIVYFVLFPVYLIMFNIHIVRRYARSSKSSHDTVDMWLMLIPLLLIYLAKVSQHYNYYFSLKMIE